MGTRIGSTTGKVRRAWPALLSLVATLTMIGVLNPMTAIASTVSKNGPTLTYTAAAGETNHLIVSLASGAYTIDDSGAAIGAGAGCSSVNSTRATCPGAGITSISVNAANMNDLVWNTSSAGATITGGDGSDTLIGGNGDDILIACAGDDSLIAGGGADFLLDGFINCSGGGNDTLDGGAGADGIFGGAGNDTVTYSGRTASVYVSLDDAANDGEAGEGDNVHQDVENVTGGSGGDNITGGPGANTLNGQGGDDVLVGEQSVDPFAGGGGNDTIFGGAGADALAGGDGDNLLSGGAGNDVLHGGLGADSFDGGAGDDDMRALDGVIDAVNCGADFDTGVADLSDVVSPSCESVELSSYPPDDEFPPDDGFSSDEFPTDCWQGDFGGGGSDPFSGEVDPSCIASQSGPCSSIRVSHRATNLHRGAVSIRVSLPKGTTAKGRPCKAKLRLDALTGGARKTAAPKLKIGSASFSLKGGRSKRLEVELKPAGRRLIVRERSIPVLVSVLPRGHAAGSKVTGPVIKVEAP